MMAAAAPIVAPSNPTKQDLRSRLLPPSWGSGSKVLGTDHLGRSVLSNIVYGARVSLIVSMAVVVLGGAIGVLLGLLAGYFGGWVDDLVNWLINLQLSFPSLLLAITIAAVLGPSLRNVILVLVIASWTVYARVVRGEVVAARERTYVEAARAVGGSSGRILFKHLLPAIGAPIIVVSSFQAASAIIAEASLSFLGLGVQSGTPSWGRMLADGRSYLATSWWLATFPGVAIMLTVLALNLVGDWLRDEFDPTMKQRR